MWSTNYYSFKDAGNSKSFWEITLIGMFFENMSIFYFHILHFENEIITAKHTCGISFKKDFKNLKLFSEQEHYFQNRNRKTTTKKKVKN